jgi:ethanolamine ammonia-lyase small subunit
LARAHSVDGAAYCFSDFGRPLAPHRWAAAPVAIALHGRVALGDEIGAAFGAQLIVVLIGERPGYPRQTAWGLT